MGDPVWKCDYFYIILRTQVIFSHCVYPQKYDVSSVTGCTDPPPKNNGGCQVQAGNPITICSGNKYEEKTDYRGAGTNSLAFTRAYNGLSLRSGTLGVGWRHNFERTLVIQDSTHITSIRADGQQLDYVKSGGVWNSDSDVILTLSEITGGYQLFDNDKTKETYDSSGALLSIQKVNSYTQTLTYSSGKLTSVTDNLGRSLRFTYDTNNLLVKMTDPDGKIYSYAYAEITTGSPAYKLSTVSYPDNDANSSNNPVVTYHYENTVQPTALTGVTDELGHRYATWGYDDTGRATLSKHAGDVDATTLAYNTDGTTTVTYPLGERITYTYAMLQNAQKIVREDRATNGSIPAAYRTYSYDAKGFLASMRDWNGTITNYVYDANGLQTSRTEAYGTPQQRTITTTWNTGLRVPTRIAEPGRTTDFTYDSHGNLLTRTETDTTAGSTRRWTFTYDSLGNVLTENGPRTDVADVITYTYTSPAKNLATVTDALGHVTTITGYNKRGLPLSYTDPNGTKVSLAYDARGRLQTHTIHSSGGDAVTTLAYNAAGLITRITQPDGSYLNYEYDDAQRLKAVFNNLGERIEYTLDGAGNITQEQRKAGDGGVRYQQSHTYDVLGRLLKDIGFSAAQATTYGYDGNGNRVSSTDARNYTTGFAFDALNRLIAVTDPLGKAAATGYDARDNITSRSDFRGLVTRYSYNGFNQVVAVTSPDTGITTFTPDGAGNVVKETDARGVTTTRTFDALNRVLTEIYASPSENVTYSYDDTFSGNKGIGRLTGWSDPSGGAALTYDDRGNVVRKSQTIGSRTYTISYAFNLANRLTQITYPSGRQVQYVRNSGGRVTAVNQRPTSSGGYAAVAGSIAYEPYGPWKSLILGNGLTATRALNKNYWIAALKTQQPPVTVQDVSLAYDNAGNIIASTDNLASDRSQSFTLDALNRLVQAASGAYGTVSFTYDDNGNRRTRITGAVTETYSYLSASNRVSGIVGGASGARNFTYTASGNVASDDRGSAPDLGYSYNGRGRIVKLTKAGATKATYTYAADGARAGKTAGAVTTQYLYDEDGQLLAEHNGATGAVIREYLYLEDGTPLAQIKGGATYYLHTDQLGTPLKITSADKTVMWDRVQQPFGETVSASGAVATPLRFPGQYFDTEDGNYYNYFRNYDPTIGRYIQTDPIGLEGGRNLYSYATQNPLHYIDPMGQAAVSAGVVTGEVIDILSGIRVLNSIVGMLTPTQEAQKDAEYLQYKKRCNEQTPPGLDKCQAARFRLERNKECKALREAWDKKWMPERHANDVIELDRAIRNAEEDVNKYCRRCD